MNDLDVLKEIIKEELNDLSCATHREVCSIRDSNYIQLEGMILSRLLDAQEELSVQSVLAELETELTHI